MCQKGTVCLWAALACPLFGCGTIGNLSDFSQAAPYGGIARDLSTTERLFDKTPQVVKKSPVKAGEVALAASFVAIDLPLSLAADTLTLPLTIPAKLLRAEEPAASKSRQTDDKAALKNVLNTYLPSPLPDLNSVDKAHAEDSTTSAP